MAKGAIIGNSNVNMSDCGKMDVGEGIEVIVGTYEELTLGYRLVKDLTNKKKFISSFTDHSQTASVKTVAISRNGIVACGSSDESIKLFNLRKRVEVGTLLHHEGSVLGLQFFGKNHLFSHSEDGTIAIWKTGSWECLRTLRGHKGPVYSFGIHPSGKLALSCGKDKTVRTWNLMTARNAYITNNKQAVEILAWSPDGSKYVMVTGNCVDVSSFEADVIQQIHTDVRISCITFTQNGLLLLGCEKGHILMYNTKTFEKVFELETGTVRIKSMAVLESDTQLQLFIASSDGYIKLYDVSVEEEVCCKLVAEIGTGFRLLSIAAIDMSRAGDKSHSDEDEEHAVAEAEASGAESDDEDSRQSEDSSDEAEESQKRHNATVDVGPSAADSRQRGKRKRKHSSTQGIDNKPTVKTSDHGSHKQSSKIRKKQRKNLTNDSAHSATYSKRTVVESSGSGKQKLGAKKMKQKH